MRYVSFILLHTCETKAYKIYANFYQNGRRISLDHWVSRDPIFMQIFTKSCIEKVYTVELVMGWQGWHPVFWVKPENTLGYMCVP
jgi:hypothetical protein